MKVKGRGMEKKVTQQQTCQPPKHANLEILKKSPEKPGDWDLKPGDFQKKCEVKIKKVEFSCFKVFFTFFVLSTVFFCCFFLKSQFLFCCRCEPAILSRDLSVPPMFHAPRFPSNIRSAKFSHFQHRFFNTNSNYLNCLAVSRFSDSP